MKLGLLWFSLLIALVANAEPPKRWGVLSSSQSVVNVTVSSAQALQANPDRVYLKIQNQHASAVLTIRLKQANGGYGGVSVVAGGSWEPVPPPGDSVFLNSSTGVIPALILEGLE